MNKQLEKLNCMNYHVQDHLSGDYWYAQSGLRSLFNYAKISGSTFRHICEKLIERGEVTIEDSRPLDENTPKKGAWTLTMI